MIGRGVAASSRSADALPENFSMADRVMLIAEILVTYVRVRWLMQRHDVRTVVAALRADASDAHEPPAARALALRLAIPMRRVLDPLPWDSRCLMRSLTLLTMLARRGIPTELKIGVQSGAEFTAHAWIEHDRRPLLPTEGFDALTTL